MAVKFLFFAQSARWMGKEEMAISLEEPQGVARLLKLEELEPLRKYSPTFRVAVNQEFAQDDTIVYDGDEVAILPPVSGG